MGMSKQQFSAYIRFVLSALKDMLNEQDVEKKDKKAKELIANLEAAIDH